MFPLKIIFGGKLRRRFFDNQAVELFLQCAGPNRMILLGKPDTYKVQGSFQFQSRIGVSFFLSYNKAIYNQKITDYVQIC